MGELGVIVSVKRPTEWLKATNDDGVVRTTHMLVIDHSIIRCDIEKLTLTTLFFIDVDECTAQVNPCDVADNSECKNTDGSYNCQ